MTKPFYGDTVAQRMVSRLAWINDTAANTVGGDLALRLLHADEQTGEYVLQGSTVPYMRNVIGTLHGGSCAVLVDQAMGLVANCLFDDDRHAPTSQLQLNFHRPMVAGEDFVVRVHVVASGRTLIHTSAEVFAVKAPDKLCISANAVFFRGSRADHRGNTTDEC